MEIIVLPKTQPKPWNLMESEYLKENITFFMPILYDSFCVTWAVFLQTNKMMWWGFFSVVYEELHGLCAVLVTIGLKLDLEWF